MTVMRATTSGSVDGQQVSVALVSIKRLPLEGGRRSVPYPGLGQTWPHERKDRALILFSYCRRLSRIEFA